MVKVAYKIPSQPHPTLIAVDEDGKAVYKMERIA
jgi:hypothetical protein